MEDSSLFSISYQGKLERVSQDKRARTLISCYAKIKGELLMKRPASVLATLIIFGMFILMGIMVAVKNTPSDIGSLLAATIMPLLFLVGWIGVYLAKNWARIYSSCLIVLFCLLFVLLPYIIGEEQSKDSEFIIFKIISFALFAWWAYSLALGKASKEYFKSGANA